MVFGDSITDENRIPPLGTEDNINASMVFGMRLLLSVAALMTLIIAPNHGSDHPALTWAVFISYTLQSVALFIAAQKQIPFWRGKIVYRLDVCWYAMMVYCSGGNNSFFFPFFFFVILVAAFQWGFDEGARITLAAAVLQMLAVLAGGMQLHTDLGRLLLRSTFILALGYMLAYWGGLSVAQRRRLGLLRDVSQLSNPRFGVDHTLAAMLDKTRRFYHAERCILLMRDKDGESWVLRSASDAAAGRPITQSRLSAAAAAPLLVLAPQQTVIYARPLSARLAWSGECSALAPGQQNWTGFDAAICDSLADLLDARAFISTPLALRKGRGRIYIVSSSNNFTRTDATFLNQVSAQFFPVIENIELLDGLASDAASRERKKIARDLHDTTIQPYIGLRHAISALRHGVEADNPLAAELDKLLDMSATVIGDMRNFTRTVREGDARGEPELLIALRRQAQQTREFYGIDIAIEVEGSLDISDRMSAEIFQIGNEGISNIRKHTRARHGLIHLACRGNRLRIRIENENPDGGNDAGAGAGHSAPDFLPVSIAERTVALGGQIEVRGTADGGTAVHLAIPV